MLEAYSFIQDNTELEGFYQAHKTVEWFALDTEFVGEKRYETLLCLIQVASPLGLYLIDPFKVSDLSPFLKLLENPKIRKLTHAGENDYRLLNLKFGTIPQNIFDMQVGAGFIGHGYPISYSKLVERELGIEINKSYAAADWESRPLKPQQLTYALSDVAHLNDLYLKISNKLNKKKRLAWVESELKTWQNTAYYLRDPYKEVLNNTLMQNLRPQKQYFLMRLYEWRRQEAEKFNYSKEMVLPAKYIAPILRGIDSGKQSLLDNRTIPDRIISQHWDTFQRLFYAQPTTEEETILKRLPPQTIKDDPDRETSMELIYVLVKLKCIESDIAPQLVLNKSELSQAQSGDILISDHADDWRQHFLGENLIKWLNARENLTIETQENEVTIRMKT
jgi:ribonuclease D